MGGDAPREVAQRQCLVRGQRATSVACPARVWDSRGVARESRGRSDWQVGSGVVSIPAALRRQVQIEALGFNCAGGEHPVVYVPLSP